MPTNSNSGIKISNKFYSLDFYHNGQRLRIITRIPASPDNLKKTSKLLLSIRLDLERDSFYIGTYKDKIKITKSLEKLDAHYERKQQSVNVDQLLYEQIALYQQMVKAGNRAQSTFDGYCYAINLHLIPFFKDVPLNQVDKLIIEELISRIPFTKSRVKLILRPLKEILGRAKIAGLIKANPFEDVDPAIYETHRKTSEYIVDPFSKIEIIAILNNCEHECIRNFIHTGFYSGMRIGEMFALTWSDVDFKNEVIRIDKAASVKRIIKSPKSRAGFRDIEMTPESREALQSQFKITGKDNDRVFKSPTGKNWIKTGWFGDYWARALKLAKVKYRNPYQMRHTFISMMLEAGNSPMVLYPMVGHTTPQVIYQYYGRFIKKTGKILKLPE